MGRASRILVALAVVTAACVPAEAEAPPPNPEMVAVAEALCPLMWRWQLSVGSAMNQMSEQALHEEDPRVRHRIYLRGIGRVRVMNDRLAEEVVRIPRGPYSGFLMSDVLDGLAAAEEVLDGLVAFVEATDPDVDVSPHDVIPTIFLDVEKVIDLPKPELATYYDDELIRAFVTVPQCQFGVKDANDGVPRYIPLEGTAGVSRPGPGSPGTARSPSGR